MTPEYLQEEVAADSCLVERFALANNNTRKISNHSVVALKFGGTSLLGAERMLHAAGLVRTAAQDSDVVVVVSAMKGVTDRLLSISRALAEGKLSHASNEAEGLIHLHFNVLQDLELGEENQDRVRRGLQLLGRDLLHEVPLKGRVVANAGDGLRGERLRCDDAGARTQKQYEHGDTQSARFCLSLHRTRGKITWKHTP